VVSGGEDESGDRRKKEGKKETFRGQPGGSGKRKKNKVYSKVLFNRTRVRVKKKAKVMCLEKGDCLGGKEVASRGRKREVKGVFSLMSGRGNGKHAGGVQDVRETK